MDSEGMVGPANWSMAPSKEKIIQGSTLFFNMMPKEIRNELPRAVKDMLSGANPRSLEWQSIEEVINKLERLIVRTGIQWKDLLKPFITQKISGLKNLEQFFDWLSSIYNYGMEEVVFGQDSKPMTYVNEDPKVNTIDKFLSSE